MATARARQPFVEVQPDIGDLALIHRSGLFDREWFAAGNPDLVNADTDPLTHYHRYGWQEGRWPNPYFDPDWYAATYPDVQKAGIDPLLHYIENGEWEGRQPVAHFDPGWYRFKHEVPRDQLCLAHFLQHRRSGTVSPVQEFDAAGYVSRYPDVLAAGIDPFEHYMVQGAQEGRQPSAEFDQVFYRARYLAGQPDTNPLLHFRKHRREPGVFLRRPSAETTGIPQEFRRNTQPGPLCEDVQPLPPGAVPRAKVLAFYLPQFHPVQENDAWWGRGFTEWTNVSRALPRFAGHYQPRTPRDLGYYRLQGTDTLRQQVELARGGGVHGFVFYFYWFNGKRLLNGPVDALLADPTVDFPFCLMWANENWTRRWDGSENEVLIAQDYRQSDEPALVAEFVRHFRDPRYIRLEGRPVLMVYRAGLIPRTAEAVARWRALFAMHGEDPAFVMAQSFDERDPRLAGMDAAVEFPPHKLSVGAPRINATLDMLDPAATADVVAYGDVAASSDLAVQPYPLIRTAVPSWDNDARRQGAGLVLHGSTPAAYQAWLGRLVDAAVQQPVLGEALVCVNAWNEWAEGAYLEPDVHFGAAYLNATARAVAGPARSRLLLVGHDAFAAGAQLLLLNLGRTLRRRCGVALEFMLLGGGVLEGEYRAVAPTTVFATAADLARAARPGDAAIVNSAASSAACVALAGAGVPCTLLVHELPRLLQEYGLVDLAREAAAVAQLVVFPAVHVRDRFHELASLTPGKVVIMPQGVCTPVRATDAEAAAMRDELRLPPDAVLAVGLGYADLRKGFDLFLQAWRLAQAADRAIHMLWIGDVDPTVRAYLGAEMAAAAATGTFHHMPRRADAAQWLAAADVHLLCSREDPFPSVALEAMSAGVPTVAFEDSGGVPDLLREHGAGVSVPLGDATAMVRQLRALALGTRPEDRERMRAATRRHFAWDAYADELLALARPALRSVSVVVPNYNYGRYLEGRLRSVFAQTHAVAEVLVLDDASADDSAEVTRRVAHEAGRVVGWHANANNSGSVFQQWRRAADRARGEWVWLAEADDSAEPGFLQALCGALDGAPDAVMAFTDSRAVDADGRAVSASYQDYYARVGGALLAADGVYPAADVLRHCLADRNLILNASAVLWRRSALQSALRRCGPELEGYRMAGDWRVYAEVLSQGGTVAYVAQPLNIHRRHAGSVTGSLPVARHLDEVARMQRHMRSVLGGGPALAARQRRALAEAKAALLAR